MSEPALIVADAIVDEINGREWLLDPIVSRVYLREENLLQDGNLHVFVFPWSFSHEASARGFAREDHTTWLVVCERLQAIDNTAIDQRVEFCKQLRDGLLAMSLPAIGDLSVDVTGIDTDTVYNFEHLHSDSLFMQMFALNWRAE